MLDDNRRRTTAERVSGDQRRPRWSRRWLIASGAAIATGTVVSRPAAAGHRTAAGTAPLATGHDSAELAVEAYLGALAAGDFDAAMAAFAVGPYVERFDFRASLERVRGYQPLSMLPLPSTDPFNVAVNLEQRRAAVAGQVVNQYFTLVHPAFDRSSFQPLASRDAVYEFAASFEATMVSAPLAELDTYELVALEEVDPDAAEAYHDERTAEHDAELLAVIGADESAELAVRSSVLGRDVFLLFRLVRYGDAWAIEQLGGLFSTLVAIPVAAAGTLEAGTVGDDGADDSVPEVAVPTTTP